MGKKNSNQNVLTDAERAAHRLNPVTPPTGHVLEPTSGVERDFREADAANGK